MADIVPSYSFQTPELPESRAIEYAGTQGVIFIVEPDQLDWLISKIESWFEDRDEIILVDHGLSDKKGIGTVIMEWEGFEIDQLFLAILRDDEMVFDYAVYTRPEG
jgi:hypothetical protein